jgi:hypothetical protein
MKICLACILMFSLASCDLLQWNLDKIEYSNFEVTSSGPVGFSPEYNTTILEDQKSSYSWGGSYLQSSGLIKYFLQDTIYNYKEVQIGYNSNVLLNDNDTILIAFNAPDRIVLNQFHPSTSLIQEYDSLFEYVYAKLGLVIELRINDIERLNNIYLLTGQVQQTIGEQRSILIAVTRNLEPLWLRTYISNSFATNIECTLNNDIYLTGIRNSHNYIIKTNLAGNYFEIRDFPDLGRDNFSDMEIKEQTIFFTSCLKEYPFKIRVVSFSNDLKVNWFMDLPREDSNHPVIEINKNGNIIETHASYNLIYLTEIESQFGSILWCNQFMNDKFYSTKGILQTSDSGYFIVSESNEGEFKVIKTDEEGATRLHPFSSSCR